MWKLSGANFYNEELVFGLFHVFGNTAALQILQINQRAFKMRKCIVWCNSVLLSNKLRKVLVREDTSEKLYKYL